MRNKRIAPGQLVPEAIRLEVYKEALHLVENWNTGTYGRTEPQLCIILPIILWGLSSAHEDAPNDEFWIPSGTPIMFPEMKGIAAAVSCEELVDDELKYIRIDWLLRAIVKLQGQAA